MKKILIFSLVYYPHHVSGAEAAIKEITDRIPEIQFHMVTLRFGAEPAEEKLGNVIVHRIGFGSAYLSKMLFPLLAAREAKRLHGEYQFDALWAMMTYMLLPTILAKMLGVDVPHILTLQDGDPYEKVFGRARIKPFLPLIDRGFRTATVIQAISKYLAEWPPRRGAHVSIEVIHNGANPRDMHEDYSAAEVEALKQKLGKREGDVYLVNTARLEHQKANDVTIHALTMLAENIKLLLVGGGSEESALKDLAKKLGHRERVIFAGHVDREKVTVYRKASDIFIGPSRSEGLGNAFLSAMASGLPVVATREGGLAEFVFDKDSGKQTAWVVRKDSPQEIAEAVQDIIAHPEEVKTVTAGARAMVVHEFNWDIVAREMKEKIFDRSLDIVKRAENMAKESHKTQVRKSDDSPYIEHPRAVAEMLASKGLSEIVIAAGWVHDVVEDAGVSLEKLTRELGQDVAGIVHSLTEDKSLQWEERKQKYIESIRRASPGAKMVALADKVHNLHSLIATHAVQGSAVWEKFNRGREKKLWFEEEMLKVFKESLRDPLVNEYEKLVEKMRRLD